MASRPPSRTAIFSRACGWRSIGASTVPRWRSGTPQTNAMIAAPHRAGAAVVGELRGQRLVRAVVLGRHHQPGGVLVEPVHDAGPPDAADAGKAGAAMGDQRVDQRAGLVAGGGMHHEALRLVDDDDVVVLVDDIERDILARGLGGDRLRHVDCDRIAGGDMISGVAEGAPLRLTEPARISAFSRERDSSGRRTASTRSSRVDPSSPATDDFQRFRIRCSMKCLVSAPPETGFHLPDHEESCMTETVAPEPTPEQAALVYAGAADDADRGPDHGAGGRGRPDRHRLPPFPLRGKRVTPPTSRRSCRKAPASSRPASPATGWW